MVDENTEHNTPELLDVDLGGGVKAKLPAEDAKKYISWKDSRTASYKELENNYNVVSKSVKELSEKSKLLESVKESQYETIKGEIETRLKSDYESRIAELHNKLLSTAVDAAIGSHPEVITDASARQDLKQLFISTTKDISDENISEKLNDFIKEKPHFLRVKKEEAKAPVTKSKVTPPTPVPNASEELKRLLGL